MLGIVSASCALHSPTSSLCAVAQSSGVDGSKRNAGYQIALAAEGDYCNWTDYDIVRLVGRIRKSFYLKVRFKLVASGRQTRSQRGDGESADR